MSYASLAASAPLSFDLPARLLVRFSALRGVSTGLRMAFKAGVFTAQSLVVGGLFWVVLAGPGLVSDRHSTVALAKGAISR